MSPAPIKLLLTDGDSLAPVLGPLSRESAAHAALPERRLRSSLSVPGNSDNLVDEQWGLVLPTPARGKTRRQWLEPLCELRAKQCGLASADDIRVFYASPGMNRQEARALRAKVEAVPSDRRPGYLLIAGDLDEISLEVQQELTVCASVGRLCFTLDDGRASRLAHEAYCAKILDVEGPGKTWDARPRLLFYASHDGSEAVQDGYHDLIARCHADAEADTTLALAGVSLFGRADDHQWYTTDTDPAAQASTLLHSAAMLHPAVLLSLTHGLGETDPERQRMRQGAVCLQESAGKRRTEILDHGFFERSFLPRGFWFFKACFGAGTPMHSVYEPWLDRLYDLGHYSGNPRDALRYLAAPSGRPFIARLPQTVLARPDGPLGMLAHVDMAWTYGFEALDESNLVVKHEDHGPYYDVMRMVASGHRFGAAAASLSEKAEEIGTRLALLYGDSELLQGTDSAPRAMLRAWLWMRYLDLSGFILLGDPAARLPVWTGGEGTDSPKPTGPTLDAMEKAVLAYLRQRQPPSEIARNAGVKEPTLRRWVRIYQEAGRRELARASSPKGGDS